MVATWLVTGGCGFIGSHLSAALRARGDAVRVLDDLSTGSRDNLAPGAELLVGDVADAEAVAAAMRGVDGCFHLAAIASVERGVREWRATHRTNLSGTIAVLDAAREAGRDGPVPVVYASSAAVYGEQETVPIPEAAPTRPLSAYGADKLGCELHARVAGHVHGIPTVGLRFFNVYGPRQDPRSPYSGVISIFCDRLARGGPVELFGDGGQTRDFVYVGDVVAALIAAIGAARPEPQVFNVCTGSPISVASLALTIATLAAAVPELRRRPARLGEIRHSVGAPEAARRALGLGEPTPLTEGLAAVLGWMRAGRPGLASAEQPQQPQDQREPEQDREAEDRRQRPAPAQPVGHAARRPSVQGGAAERPRLLRTNHASQLPGDASSLDRTGTPAGTASLGPSP